MAPKRDYYDVLGVDRVATDAEIKKAFRAIALRDHPDKSPGDVEAENRFKAANEAYAVLSDPDKRAAYDRFGHAAFGPPGSSQPTVSEAFEGILADLLGRRPKRKAGRDLRYTLELTFVEAAFGVEKQIQFPTRRECDACRGQGTRAGSGAAAAKVCSACAGKGELGFMGGGRTCPTCKGAGRIVLDPCTKCEGVGTVRIERTFSVKIPPATEDGAVQKVEREGEPGLRGGPAGDLHIHIRVAAHPLFQRQQFDVLTEVPVSISQAALGGYVEVPTLDGRVRMRVPEGTQSGRLFRLRGKGIPKKDGKSRGDHQVRLVVETPTNLSARQKELLEELGKESGETALGHPRKKTFLDRVKELWE
jgi:molecular chaperone DnaJ